MSQHQLAGPTIRIRKVALIQKSHSTKQLPPLSRQQFRRNTLFQTETAKSGDSKRLQNHASLTEFTRASSKTPANQQIQFCKAETRFGNNNNSRNVNVHSPEQRNVVCTFGPRDNLPRILTANTLTPSSTEQTPEMRSALLPPKGPNALTKAKRIMSSLKKLDRR